MTHAPWFPAWVEHRDAKGDGRFAVMLSTVIVGCLCLHFRTMNVFAVFFGALIRGQTPVEVAVLQGPFVEYVGYSPSRVQCRPRRKRRRTIGPTGV